MGVSPTIPPETQNSEGSSRVHTLRRGWVGKGLRNQLDYHKECVHITSHHTQDKSQCITYVWRIHCLARRPHTPTRFLVLHLSLRSF